jgi:uncharacterized repeat protein (TIGR01451 family)
MWPIPTKAREMSKHSHSTHTSGLNRHDPERKRPAAWWMVGYWVVGMGSLIWLLLRSGTKPKRLAYPCQRAAAATSAGFVAYVLTLVGSSVLFRRLRRAFSFGTLALLSVCLLLAAFLQGSVAEPVMPVLAASPALPGWTAPGAVSDVFAITNVPVPQYSLDGGSVPGGVSADEALHDDGVNALVSFMESQGDYFYKTAAHPAGLFDTQDVIVIKVNNQWGGRNSTNTDVVKGVIYRLVHHPDGFSGAVILAENTQGQNANWEDASEYGYNAQDTGQSYQDVADAFAGQGYHVCTETWGNLSTQSATTIVSDYNSGNQTDGYVLVAGEPSEGTTSRKLSYPKFAVNCNGMNIQVSMRQGIWNAGSSSFDHDRLKMINLPVLKYHPASGATIALKNYLGFLTVCSGGGSLGSCSNGESRWIDPGYLHCWLLSTPSADGDACTAYTQDYGLVGRQLADIRRADLDIVDAIWVNPRNNAGYHERARRLDVLLASRDPFALDYYASDYVLAPLIQAYESSIDYRQSMASTRGGLFRAFMMNNVERLRGQGMTDTINLSDSLTAQQELAQFNVYVADADEPLPSPSPTVTLQSPNGGESWEIGTQHAIQWSSTNLEGNVRLEYSTDGFSSSQQIAASTANDGVFSWAIPDQPSSNVRVRVSSVITPSINDVSNAPFTIALPSGAHQFSESRKRVSHAILSGGERITYSITLYEQALATISVADTVPTPLTFVPGSATIEPAWKGTVTENNGVFWSGIVTWSQPVTITFQADVPVTTATMAITNRAQLVRDGSTSIEREASSVLNGHQVYLSLILNRP